MKKLLLGVGALLMASAAVPASAHDWNGDSGYSNGYENGYRYNSGSGYVDAVRAHVRACRLQERFHERFGQRSDRYDNQGFGAYGGYNTYGRGEDRDGYHGNRGGVQNCGYWYAQFNNLQRYRDHDRYDRYSW